MDVYDEFTSRMDTSAILIYDAKIAEGSKVIGRVIWKGMTCYFHIYGVGMVKGTMRRRDCIGSYHDQTLVKAAGAMLKLIRARTPEDWKYWSTGRTLRVNNLALALAEPGPKSWGRRLFELDLEGLSEKMRFL